MSKLGFWGLGLGAALLLGCVASQPNVQPMMPAASAQPASDWDTLEAEILQAHNRVRQDPASYLPVLTDFRARMRPDGTIPDGCGPNCTLHSGFTPDQVDAAIAALRSQAPVGPLATAPAVASAAEDHARDLEASGQFSHTGSDGSSVGDRLRRRGVSSSAWAENISAGSRTAEAVMRGWIISPGHRQNLFRATMTHAGVGCRPHSQYGSTCVIKYVQN